MCIVYKSVDDFVNSVLFLVSPSLFDDIYKCDNEFINIKNEFEILKTGFENHI